MPIHPVDFKFSSVLAIVLVCLFINRYGDRSPRSIPARIFGIIWTLIGLVIISVLVGALSTTLTSVTVEHPIILYGSKVTMSLAHSLLYS